MATLRVFPQQDIASSKRKQSQICEEVVCSVVQVQVCLVFRALAYGLGV